MTTAAAAAAAGEEEEERGRGTTVIMMMMMTTTTTRRMKRRVRLELRLGEEARSEDEEGREIPWRRRCHADPHRLTPRFAPLRRLLFHPTPRRPTLNALLSRRRRRRRRGADEEDEEEVVEKEVMEAGEGVNGTMDTTTSCLRTTPAHPWTMGDGIRPLIDARRGRGRGRDRDRD